MSEHIGPAGPGRDLSDGATIHCMPVNDLVMHESASDCVCIPDVEQVPNDHGPDGWLYTHHSLDGREANEDERRLLYGVDAIREVADRIENGTDQ